MAKFGKTGLREVTTGGLPTRSDLHTVPLVNLSMNSFKRPRMVSHKSSAAANAAQDASSARQEPHKVKTAAERKTYVDALPLCGSSVCSSSMAKSRRKRVSFNQAVEWQ